MTPVVFIPGHLCTHDIYAPQIASLGARAHLVADTMQDDTLGAMADRVLANAPDRFVMAGLSMGGMIAMEVMARAPGRVAGALLMDTDPNAARPKENEYRTKMMERVRAEGLHVFVDQFTPRLYGHSAEVSAMHLEDARAMMGAMPLDVFYRQSNALMTRRDMLPLMANVSCPVTVIVGSEDVICPPVVHRSLADSLPNSTYVEIPRCGHIASLEAPEDVNAALAALLTQADAA